MQSDTWWQRSFHCFLARCSSPGAFSTCDFPSRYFVPNKASVCCLGAWLPFQPAARRISPAYLIISKLWQELPSFWILRLRRNVRFSSLVSMPYGITRKTCGPHLVALLKGVIYSGFWFLASKVQIEYTKWKGKGNAEFIIQKWAKFCFHWMIHLGFRIPLTLVQNLDCRILFIFHVLCAVIHPCYLRSLHEWVNPLL